MGKIKLDNNQLDLLFQICYDFMMKAGGDGGAIILCDYTDENHIADYFESKLEHFYPEMKRVNHNWGTIFMYEQESIVIRDKKKVLEMYGDIKYADIRIDI